MRTLRVCARCERGWLARAFSPNEAPTDVVLAGEPPPPVPEMARDGLMLGARVYVGLQGRKRHMGPL